MEFVEITEENADEFSGFVDTDVSCNLERCFFFGIGVVGDDDNPVGALVYELINYDSDEDTTSRIHSSALLPMYTSSPFFPGKNLSVSFFTSLL